MTELEYWRKRAELAEKALFTNEVIDWRNWAEFKKLEPKK